jgi:hypothetical protein
VAEDAEHTTLVVEVIVSESKLLRHRISRVYKLFSEVEKSRRFGATAMRSMNFERTFQ